MIIVLICITSICFKLSFNTIFMYSELKESAEELWNRSFPIVAQRGVIMDKNNNVLDFYKESFHKTCQSSRSFRGVISFILRT